MTYIYDYNIKDVLMTKINKIKTLGLIFILHIFYIRPSYSQNNGPWNSPLNMAWSSDGTQFTNTSIFQDSSGVPCVVRWKGDTLICAFQWFRQPMNSPSWDRVAVKFSYDAGKTWEEPIPIVISGLPTTYQRPFDPTLAVLNADSLRIYYSSSDGFTPMGLDALVNTYSAVSTDGIHYVFEQNARFDHPTRPVIDPAILYFNGQWHYSAPAGAPQDGTFHATSADGLQFTQQANYSSDASHNWTGNLMLNQTNEMRFYGSGQRIWHNSTTDGFTWKGFTNTNLQGGDPSIIKINDTSYLAIYVGPPYNNNTFTCGTIYTDPRDQQKYGTVQIGSDCWMKRNLNYGKMVLSNISTTVHSDMFNNNIPEKYAANNDSLQLNPYGGLYEWDELMNYNRINGAQGLCPQGWHVSTDEEWQRLIKTAGGQLISNSAGRGGNALKLIGEGMGAGMGTDVVGFSARHAGDRDGFGIFNGLHLRSIFWTSTPVNQNQAYHYTLWSTNDTIQRLALGSNTGFSCRCVKNNASTGFNHPLQPSNPIYIHPNPFTHFIRLSIDQQNHYCELIDIMGQLLWRGPQIEEHDFSYLTSGIYFLKIYDGIRTETIKVVKK